jgi:hypothetical protein
MKKESKEARGGRKGGKRRQKRRQKEAKSVLSGDKGGGREAIALAIDLPPLPPSKMVETKEAFCRSKRRHEEAKGVERRPKETEGGEGMGGVGLSSPRHPPYTPTPHTLPSAT